MAKSKQQLVTDAVETWQNLSDSDREAWTVYASGTGLTGFNQFLGAYLKQHKD